MKYYKLTRTGGGYDSIHNGSKAFELGKIYPENCTLGNMNNVGTYAKDSSFWIKVSEIDYFVQEGKMPEYFAVKRDKDDPLWQKYINWLNTTYNSKYEGDSQDYYGFDGKTDYFWKLSYFKNNLVELTLEQWDKIINKTMEEEFELQKVWFIELTEENKELVEKWHRKISKVKRSYAIGSFYGVYSDGSGDAWSHYSLPKHTQVITTEQFIKYILNQEVMEENKEIIGWKLKADCEKYRKVALQIMNDYNGKGSRHLEERADFIETDNITVKVLKEAGVLGLWFEPVHKEKILKFGGYDVTFEKVNSGMRISCNGETGTFSQVEAIYNHFNSSKKNFSFGGQIVKEVIYLNGKWDLEIQTMAPIFIKIGCTTGTWDEFVAIYKEAKSML